MDKKRIGKIVNDVLGTQFRDIILDMEGIQVDKNKHAKYERIERLVREGKLINSSSFLL